MRNELGQVPGSKLVAYLEDGRLIIEDRVVSMRTTHRLERVDVIYRRIDGHPPTMPANNSSKPTKANV